MLNTIPEKYFYKDVKKQIVLCGTLAFCCGDPFCSHYCVLKHVCSTTTCFYIFHKKKLFREKKNPF